jgi:hypothetical protein
MSAMHQSQQVIAEGYNLLRGILFISDLETVNGELRFAPMFESNFNILNIYQNSSKIFLWHCIMWNCTIYTL